MLYKNDSLIQSDPIYKTPMASFTERYHEATKYNPYSIDRLGPVEWGEQPPPFKSLDGGMAHCFAEHLPFLKKFLGEGVLDLPLSPSAEPFIRLETLAHLVYCTAGITGVLRTENGSVHFRANPSAGGLYPVELYFAVRDCQGLPDGLYYFHPLLCGAMPVATSVDWQRMAHLFADTETVATSRLLFFFAGAFKRSLWRYKERSYRRILLDAGCLVANVQAQASALGLASRLLGGFRDAELEELLDLTRGEVPLLAVAVDPRLATLPAPALQSPSAPPCQAVKRLNACNFPGLFLQQNEVERIAGNFLPPPLPVTHAVAGERIALLPSPYSATELAAQLPRLGLTRRSCRCFAPRSIGPDACGALLQLAYRQHMRQSFAGNQLKSWLVVHAVDGLTPGVYRYLPDEHALIAVSTGSLREAMQEVALGQALAEDCAALLVHTADLDEATALYGDRAYRYLKADAGALGEALNLYAGLYHLGVSGIGAYFDDMANATLHIPATDAILYMTALGVEN
jgi:SagB-type dehydrogenase family enzyme